MNRKTLFSSIGLAALTAMLGCSTSPALVSADDPFGAPVDVPPPEISIDLPLESPDEQPGFKPCKLGTSCIAMDPRPFEPCLLSTRECTEKATEPLLVGEPKPSDPPTIIKTR